MAEPIEMPIGRLGLAEVAIYKMGSSPPQERAIIGVCYFAEKHWESLLQCMQQKGSCMCQ